MRSCIISSGKLHILILFRFQSFASYTTTNTTIRFLLLFCQEKSGFFFGKSFKKIEYMHLFIIGSARANVEADWGKVIVVFSN